MRSLAFSRRSSRDRRRSGQAHRHQGEGHAGLQLRLRPSHCPLERQRGHEGYLRRPQHRLRRGGKARLYRLNAVSLAFTARSAPFRAPRHRGIVVLPILLNFSGSERHRMAGLLGRWPVLLASWSAVWPFSTATARAATLPSGGGSLRAVWWPPYCGLSRPYCSPGTWRTSAATTRPTGRWGGDRFHDLDLGVRHRDFVRAPRSTPSRSIRRRRTRPKAPETPWARAAPPWRTLSARAKRAAPYFLRVVPTVNLGSWTNPVL